MVEFSKTNNQIEQVNSFHDLLNTSFQGVINAMCWNRKLVGDFSEIVKKVTLNESMEVLSQETLIELDLSEQGQLAREILISDFNTLKAHGASPILNLIKNYERDDSYPFFPTDVYSFHVDRSPIPTATFLCTYYGEPSDILPNAQGTQKVLIPEIREELKKLYDGPDDGDDDNKGFESFLSEYFFDLHYQAKPDAKPISLGLGHLWKLAIDHPESQVLPCLHRAPMETNGQTRLMMIC